MGSVRTNFGLSIPITSGPKYPVMSRSGTTLFLDYYDENKVFHSWLTADDPSLDAPAKFKLFLRANIALGGGGWFDDFTISADRFEPKPAPRLFTQIVPAAFQISWPSYADAKYQIWYRAALVSNVWTPLGPATNGTGYMMSVQTLSDALIPRAPPIFADSRKKKDRSHDHRPRSVAPHIPRPCRGGPFGRLRAQALYPALCKGSP